MCWMLVKKAGKQVDFKNMDKAQKHNSDGYGVSWYENGEIKVYKSFNYNQFKGVVAALKKHTIVVHLRFATKGDKSYENIHPFDVPSGVMFHNGTIFGLGNYTKSDTRTLAERISKCDYSYIEDIAPLVEPYIDDKINRLVFFELNGRVTIMNEHLGIKEDGVWYSNDYHLKDEGWCRGGYCKKPTTNVTHKPAPPSNNISSVIRDTKVFVYGTLKRGHSNHAILKDATLLGKAYTTQKWAMIGKNMPFPYVLERNNKGHHIIGEVYAVNTYELNRLDRLEGVPTHYVKRSTQVTYADDSSTDTVGIYIKATTIKDYETSKTLIAEWKSD